MNDLIQDLVRAAIAHHLDVDPRTVEASQTLEACWGLDGLDLVMVVLRLEDVLGLELPIAELEGVRLVGELMAFVGRHAAGRGALPAAPGTREDARLFEVHLM